MRLHTTKCQDNGHETHIALILSLPVSADGSPLYGHYHCWACIIINNPLDNVPIKGETAGRSQAQPLNRPTNVLKEVHCASLTVRSTTIDNTSKANTSHSSHKYEASQKCLFFIIISSTLSHRRPCLEREQYGSSWCLLTEAPL